VGRRRRRCRSTPRRARIESQPRSRASCKLPEFRLWCRASGGAGRYSQWLLRAGQPGLFRLNAQRGVPRNRAVQTPRILTAIQLHESGRTRQRVEKKKTSQKQPLIGKRVREREGEEWQRRNKEARADIGEIGQRKQDCGKQRAPPDAGSQAKERQRN